MTETELDPTPETPQIYKAKRARNLFPLLAVFGILALMALIGIAVALFSPKEDPTKIALPTYQSRGLAQEPATLAIPQPVNPAPIVAPVTEQKESPITLQPAAPAPMTPAAPLPMPAPIAIPKPASKPQSMIQWNNLPFNHAPQIAIVIDDMGVNRPASRRMVDLPAALTLSYLPYAETLAQQTATARDHGHELIVHVPMEPEDIAHHNPGPDALLTNNTAEENLRRLDKDLSQFNGYIGLNNHMGSRMTADATAMRPILQAMRNKGLWFLDSRTIGNSVAGKLADQMGVPFVSRDVFLDDTQTEASIATQLHQLEMIAQKRGYAVAIGHPYPVTIAALQSWIPQAEKQGFVLIPLSTVIAARFPNAAAPRYAQCCRDNAIEPAAGTALLPTTKSKLN